MSVGLPIRLTASGVVGTSGARQHLRTVTLAAGSANATLDLYNNADGSGTPVYTLKALANESHTVKFGEAGCLFEKGLYATFTGAGAIGSFEIA